MARFPRRRTKRGIRPLRPVAAEAGRLAAGLSEGKGLIVVGGALRTGADYLPLARELARTFAVRVMDRRGRGASGPQGLDYSVEKDCDDLAAVQAATGATAVFGHSFGGFVALEAARRTAVFSRVAVYEPGVPIAGSIPVAWVPRYRQWLAAGDTRGAFAVFVRGSGAAPGPVTRLPLWQLRAMRRIGAGARGTARTDRPAGTRVAQPAGPPSVSGHIFAETRRDAEFRRPGNRPLRSTA